MGGDGEPVVGLGDLEHGVGAVQAPGDVGGVAPGAEGDVARGELLVHGRPHRVSPAGDPGVVFGGSLVGAEDGRPGPQEAVDQRGGAGGGPARSRLHPGEPGFDGGDVGLDALQVDVIEGVGEGRRLPLAGVDADEGEAHRRSTARRQGLVGGSRGRVLGPELSDLEEPAT